MSAPIQAILGAAKYTPASVMVKLLGKINPKFKNFFTESAAYGLDTNRALDYLVNRFGNQAGQDYKSHLEREGQEGSLRPDEMASRSMVNAAEIPGKLLKSAASFGGAALAGGINKEVVPEEQTKQNPVPQEKVIQGQSPKPQSSIGSQSNPSMQSAFQNFLSKHPELGKYLDQQINQGVIPRMAAQKAKQVRKFQPMIEDIESNVGLSLEDLIARLFGGEEQKPEQQSSRSEELLSVLQQLKSMRGRK